MVVKDDEVITREYGYGALFLRRYLDIAFPADNRQQVAYRRRLADLGHDDITDGLFSYWYSGTRECDRHLMRKLFHTSEHLGEGEGGADGVMTALGFLYDNRGSLPHLDGVLADPPPLAKAFLARFAAKLAPTDNLPAVVETAMAEPAAPGKDEEPQDGGGGEAPGAGGRVEIEADEESAEVETGDVQAGANSSIRIKAKAGKIKTGTVVSGWTGGRKT